MPRVAMNLLWCVPGVGGSEEYLVRQLLGLAETQHEFEVEVCAARGFSQRQPRIAELFQVHEAPSACLKRSVRIVLEHTWLARKTRSFDIVHHGGGTLPRWGNKKALLTVHDIQWTKYPKYVHPLKLRYLQRVVPSSLARATRIAVPTQFVSRTLTEFLGTPPSRIGVVRHGLESNLNHEATSEPELRTKYSLGAGPVLVFPAITHPHKNHQFLLKLMANGNELWTDESLRVVFAGSAGSHDAVVKTMVNDLGLQHRVVMPGRVSASDRNGLLRMADAMVFPSEYEGFGAPLIEAMQLGTPVLASDCGSIPEVVGNAGVIAPLTLDNWNEAFGRLRHSRELLTAAGKERARHFTIALSAEDLVREYRSVLNGDAG
jgi:glycosyltransferase involved in cell wall biosynthesis